MAPFGGNVRNVHLSGNVRNVPVFRENAVPACVTAGAALARERKGRP